MEIILQLIGFQWIPGLIPAGLPEEEHTELQIAQRFEPGNFRTPVIGDVEPDVCPGQWAGEGDFHIRILQTLQLLPGRILEIVFPSHKSGSSNHVIIIHPSAEPQSIALFQPELEPADILIIVVFDRCVIHTPVVIRVLDLPGLLGDVFIVAGGVHQEHVSDTLFESQLVGDRFGHFR